MCLRRVRLPKEFEILGGQVVEVYVKDSKAGFEPDRTYVATYWQGHDEIEQRVSGAILSHLPLLPFQDPAAGVTFITG